MSTRSVPLTYAGTPAYGPDLVAVYDRIDAARRAERHADRDGDTEAAAAAHAELERARWEAAALIDAGEAAYAVGG